jgi:hypothetical protein
MLLSKFVLHSCDTKFQVKALFLINKEISAGYKSNTKTLHKKVYCFRVSQTQSKCWLQTKNKLQKIFNTADCCHQLSEE